MAWWAIWMNATAPSKSNGAARQGRPIHRKVRNERAKTTPQTERNAMNKEQTDKMVIKICLTVIALLGSLIITYLTLKGY
jgi:hypothetical protein